MNTSRLLEVAAPGLTECLGALKRNVIERDAELFHAKRRLEFLRALDCCFIVEMQVADNTAAAARGCRQPWSKRCD
jgi:hypothetical protein